MYSFGSPLNLLTSNFGNFIFIVLLTGLFILVILVVSSRFSFSDHCCNTLSIFIPMIAISLWISSAVLFHGLFPPYPLFPLEFLHLTSKLSVLFSLTAIFSIIALRYSLYYQCLAKSEWRFKLTFLNGLYALL